MNSKNKRLLFITSCVVLLAHKRAFLVSFAGCAALLLVGLFSVSPRYSVRAAVQQPVSAVNSLYRAEFNAAFKRIAGIGAPESSQFKFAVAAMMDDSVWWQTFKRHALSRAVCEEGVHYGCFEETVAASLSRISTPAFPHRIDLEVLSSESDLAQGYLSEVLQLIDVQALSAMNTELADMRRRARVNEAQPAMEQPMLNVVVEPFVASKPVFPNYSYGMAAIVLFSLVFAGAVVWVAEGWRQYRDLDRIEI